MAQIAEFLVQKKFEKAKDHQDEVKELEDEVAASWDWYQTNIHTALPQSPQHLKQLQDLFKILSQWNWCQNWKPTPFHRIHQQVSWESGAVNMKHIIMLTLIILALFLNFTFNLK